jgi:hypothetical protein
MGRTLAMQQLFAAEISHLVSEAPRQEGDTVDRVDLHGQMQLINAACAAKVGHYVFVSVSGTLLKDGDNSLFD